MPPGMVMSPYILGQNTQAVPFYGVQAQMYGYEDNSMQFVPRYPNAMYYDTTQTSYGMCDKNKMCMKTKKIQRLYST